MNSLRKWAKTGISVMMFNEKDGNNMKTTRIIRRILRWAMLLGLVVALPQLGLAERPETRQQQQKEMQEMMDMLKKQGMPPEQMQQMQDMFKGMEGMGRNQSSNRFKKEQQQFEAKTAGHGTAQVDVEGKRYDLKIMKCEITDRNAGLFTIQAKQAPGLDRGDLWVSGGGGPGLRNSMGFNVKKTRYEATDNPTLQLNGKTLEWEGNVVKEGKTLPLKFKLSCGNEMVDYAAPSKAKPKTAANVLTLDLGKEVHIFEAGLCSTKEFRSGNFIAEFLATATGSFRGRPAIILLSKGHRAESKQRFHSMDLLLGELTPEQRNLSPLKVKEQLSKKVETFANTQYAAIKKKYDPQIAAHQEIFDVEMPALKKQYGKMIPREKMQALAAPFDKLSEAKGKEMDKVQKQVKAMRYPQGRSFGTITVKGQDIHFGGSQLTMSDAARVPEFNNLPERTELWVTCGE